MALDIVSRTLGGLFRIIDGVVTKMTDFNGNITQPTSCRRLSRRRWGEWEQPKISTYPARTG